MTRLVCLFFVFYSFSLNAQWREPMRWGKMDKNAPEVSPFPDAAAYISNDYGKNLIAVNMDEQYQYTFIHHRRVKIQDPDKFDLTELDLYYEPGIETLSSYKAQLLLPNGKILKINSKFILKEKIDENWNIVRLGMTNLPKGTILEYRYQLNSLAIERLRNWYFQRNIPVLQSELRMTARPDLFYKVIFKSANTVIDPNFTEGLSIQKLQDIGRMRLQFTMTNQPALSPQIYSTTMEDYYAQLQFHLERIKTPIGLDEILFANWKTTADSLKTNAYLGLQYRDSTKHDQLLDAASAILHKDISDWEKLEQLYDFVNREIEWNGVYSCFSSQDINEVFTSQFGNSADLNLALLILLRKANIRSSPLLVSTRSNGKMNAEFPSFQQFNHLLVSAEIEAETILLDAGDPLRPFGMPRMEALNGYGWYLGEKENRGVKIPATPSEETMQAHFEIDSTGILKGHLQNRYKGYIAIAERNNLLQNPDGLHWEDRIAKFYPRLRIDSLSALHLNDPQLALEGLVDCTIYDAIGKDGKTNLLKPVLFSQFTENPFTQAERHFPIDMPYPISEQMVFNLSVPRGFEIVSLPESVAYKLPENAGSFQFLTNQKDDQVQVISKIKINQTLYSIQAYAGIKQFFDLIEKKLNDPIVFVQRNTKP